MFAGEAAPLKSFFFAIIAPSDQSVRSHQTFAHACTHMQSKLVPHPHKNIQNRFSVNRQPPAPQTLATSAALPSLPTPLHITQLSRWQFPSCYARVGLTSLWQSLFSPQIHTPPVLIRKINVCLVFHDARDYPISGTISLIISHCRRGTKTLNLYIHHTHPPSHVHFITNKTLLSFS